MRSPAPHDEPGVMSYGGTLLALACVMAPPYVHASLKKLSKGELPHGKRFKAALTAIPVLVVLDLEPSLVLALALAVNIALLRRRFSPELLSRRQMRAFLFEPKCLWSPKTYGDLWGQYLGSSKYAQQAERRARRQASSPAAAPAPPESPPRLPPRTAPKVRKETDEPSTPPSTPSPVEVAMESALELIEERLGPQWVACIPGEWRKAKRGRASALSGVTASEQAAVDDDGGGLYGVGSAETDVPALTPEEQRSLESGATVLKRQTGGGLACQRIRAPPHVTWETLNDFAEWPRMVDHCVGARVYETILSPNGAQGSVKCAVTLGAAFVRITAHVHHTIDRDAGRSSWVLDETQPNDCLGNSGFWLVRPDPTDPSASYVYYTTKVVLAAWVPSLINSFIGDVGLPKAVGWLQRESEKRYKAGGALR